MTLIFFEAGMRPVLKDRSAAGRKAAYARWGNRSNYTPPPPTEPGVPLDGSDPTMTAFADTWIGGGERRYGSLDDVRGTIRVLTTDDSWYPKMDMDYRSGGTDDARVVFDSTKHALVSLADADVPAYPLYRGLGFSEFSFRKPDSLLTEGATFKEDLASWTPNSGLAREFSTGERFGGKVTADVQVVMRVTNAPALPIGRHSTSRWTEVRDGADEHVASGVYRVDKVTKVGDSQYQVDVSWQGLSYDPAAVAGTEWTGVPSSSDAPSQIVRKEDDDPWALFAERMGFVAEAVEKADRSAAGRKAALARWGNRSGTETKAPAKESKPAKSDKTLNIPNADKSREFIDKHYGEWKKNLPEAQDKAMRFYQSPGYELMNGELRGQKVDAPEADLKRARKATKDLKQAIAESPPLEQDTIVYRGFSAKQFDLKPGASIRDEAFLSTSLFADGAGAFSGSGPQVKATIKLPAGTKAAAGSFKELVLPPGSEFKVVSVGKGTVELELVSPVEKADRSAAGRKAAEARWGNRGLGIAREDMPQIPKKNRDKFFAQLDAEGVGYRDETVDPRTLKQTQAGLNPKQTKVLLDAMRGGSFRGDTHTIIAAKDGHILDGHHRWDAARKYAAEGGSADIRITRVDMSIRDLLDRAARFNAEEGIESRGMETVSTFNKVVTLTFAPGLRPVLKGSRTEAARYAASVRWRQPYADMVEDREEALYRALRYGDYSGYEMGSSKWARNLGKGIGTLERKLDQFRKRKGWKKETIISNDEARKLREDYERRYRS